MDEASDDHCLRLDKRDANDTGDGAVRLSSAPQVRKIAALFSGALKIRAFVDEFEQRVDSVENEPDEMARIRATQAYIVYHETTPYFFSALSDGVGDTVFQLQETIRADSSPGVRAQSHLQFAFILIPHGIGEEELLYVFR